MISPPTDLRKYLVGPFTAELTPTRIGAASASCPQHLRLGLLTKLPDMDGNGAVELSHVDYRRQPVELVSRSEDHVTVPQPVRFEIFACPRVVGVGLFDEEGRLQASGALRGHAVSDTPPTILEFRGHQLLVKQPRTTKRT
jgi:hypothetical protein